MYQPKKLEKMVKCFVFALEKELGNVGVKKLEKRLFEKYGTTIPASIQEWWKIADILHEEFAGGELKITNNYIKKISQYYLF